MMKKTWSAEETRNIRHKKEEERNSKAIAHHDQQLSVAVNKSLTFSSILAEKIHKVILSHLGAIFHQYFVTLQNKDLNL